MLPRLLTIPWVTHPCYHWRLLGLLLGILINLLLFTTPSLHAATVTVSNTNDSGPGSLRQLLADTAPGDTLLFAASLSGQTMLLSTTITLTQDVTISGALLSNPLTLSGNRAIRVLAINPGVTSHLTGLIIADGYSQEGGGLYNQGTVTLHSVHFDRNKASRGGGIYNSQQMTITHSSLSHNQGSREDWWFGYGGAITNVGALHVRDSTFSENGAYFGGGIYSTGMLTITHSTFRQNMAAYGGGTYAFGGIVEESTFLNNQAFQMGGGIYTHADTAIHHSTFIANKAGIGSAIRYFSPVVVKNSTFSANEGSVLSNSGSMIAGGELWLYNSTLIGNHASTIIDVGGGFHLYNTVIAHSDGRDCWRIPTTNINSFSMDGTCATTLNGDPRVGPLQYYKDRPPTFILLPDSPAIDAGDNNTCQATDQSGNARPTDGNGDGVATCDIGAVERQPVRNSPEIYLRGNEQWIRNGDSTPTAADYTDFGQTSHPYDTLTRTFVISNVGAIDLTDVSVLITGSHAIDFAVTLPPNEQIGAGNSGLLQLTFHAAAPGKRQAIVEVYGNQQQTPLSTFAISGRDCRETLTVTTNANDGPGSLREALVDLCNGGTITFAETMTGQNIPLEDPLTLAKNLRLEGSAPAAAVTISGQDEVRVITVNAGVAATLHRLIIADGRSMDGYGSGIYNLGSLTITNSTIMNNFTPGFTKDRRFPPNTMGGGIYNGGQLSISNSTLTGNRTQVTSGINGGGAIFNAINVTGQLTITNSTIIHNGANWGGGLMGTATLYNTIIAGSTRGEDCRSNQPITGANYLIADGSCGATRTGDPMLGPLQDNGDGILTHALLPGSPAIDAADAAACPPTDQRGIARPLDGNGDGFAVCDLGAVEAPPVATPTPTPTATETPIPTITPTATGTPTPPAVNTVAPLPPPTPTATPTSERPPCPRGAAVEPLLSPTDQLSQTIVVNAPAAATVQVTTISGTFDAVTTDPYQVPITLLPNQRHPLTVTLAYGRLGGSPPILCQEVRTVDKLGTPLIIVQQPLPTPVPTAPPQPTPHTVYLPLVQSQ